jgi:hypothetical protein
MTDKSFSFYCASKLFYVDAKLKTINYSWKNNEMTHYGFSIDIKRSTHLERIKFNKTKMMDVVAYNHQRNFHSDMQLPIYRIHICVDDG